jgi:3-isopropylmalate/(R)-2-methylmalate dehydratase small subunit
MTASNTGRVWKFGDNIDTDVLAPGLYMKSPLAELARHCLEAVEPRFAKEVRPGDIVVGGRNFGMGSSREQAVMALRELGVDAENAELRDLDTGKRYACEPLPTHLLQMISDGGLLPHLEMKLKVQRSKEAQA